MSKSNLKFPFERNDKNSRLVDENQIKNKIMLLFVKVKYCLYC